MIFFQTIHGTLRTTEGPPNLPLSTKPTNNNNTINNNSKDGGNVNGQDKGEKKPSPSPLKKTISNCSADLKNPPGTGYTCGDCNNLFSSREVFVAHMRREHGKVNIWNHFYRDALNLWISWFATFHKLKRTNIIYACILRYNALSLQILKKHPCRQCDKSFSSSHSLCRHNRLKHKGLRKVYTCPWVHTTSVLSLSVHTLQNYSPQTTDFISNVGCLTVRTTILLIPH